MNYARINIILQRTNKIVFCRFLFIPNNFFIFIIIITVIIMIIIYNKFTTISIK